MLRYIINRLLQSILVVLGLSVMVFVILHLTGDPAALMMPPDTTQEQLAAFRREMGFDQPLHVQYVRFLRDAACGDFGFSLRHKEPVLSLVLERLPATYELTFASALLSLAIAVPIGVFSAVRRNTAWDRLSMAAAVLGQAMPVFWLGLMMIILFGLKLHVLPISGRGTLSHLILPSVTLGIYFIARNARLVRSSMLEVLRQDYVTTARAKGLSERVVIWKHAFKNSLIPVITLVGVEFGTLLGGAIITETVFAWPGVGRLTVQAINNRDFPLVMGSVMILALTLVVINLIIDLFYVFLDPRIKYTE